MQMKKNIYLRLLFASCGSREKAENPKQSKQNLFNL